MPLSQQYAEYLDALNELTGAAAVQQAQSEILAGSSAWIDVAVSEYGETALMDYWRSETKRIKNLTVAKTAQEASGRSELVQQVFSLDQDFVAAQKDYSQMRFLYDRHIDMLPESVAAHSQVSGSDESLQRNYSLYEQAELSCAKALTTYGYLRDAFMGV